MVNEVVSLKLGGSLQEAEEFFSVVMEPLGDYAPFKKRFIVGYKQEGEYYEQEVVTFIPQSIKSSEAILSLVKEKQARGVKVLLVVEGANGQAVLHYLHPEALDLYHGAEDTFKL